MPTIGRIQDVTLSNGRVIVSRTESTWLWLYSVTTFDHDNETTFTGRLTYAEAMNLLADLIKADVLETN